MISNQRELGLARNMILFHNYVLLFLAQNLMFRNKNMIEGIINKMEDTEETAWIIQGLVFRDEEYGWREVTGGTSTMELMWYTICLQGRGI